MADHVKVKTKADDTGVGLACAMDNLKTCGICLQSEAKYTCPRCNIGYCSVACYQHEKHVTCSESFYKDCVVDELKEMTNSSEDKKKVLKMLAENLEERAEEDSNDDSDDDLSDRLHGLDLDKDISTVWSRLNPKEKEEFARMLQDGRLAKLIEMWTPWWRNQENQKLVKEHRHGSTEHGQGKMPDIISEIPDINCLLKNSRPSSDCRFDLVNILFSYCFIARIHNGCHMECPVDSSQDLLKACCVLQNESRCGTVGEAIQKALDDVVKNHSDQGHSSPKFHLTVLEDVRLIISGPGHKDSLTFLSAALSDLVRLVQAAHSVVRKELKSHTRSDHPEPEELKTFKSKVFKSEKKLMFFLSWLQRYGMGMHHLLPMLQFEIETRGSEVEEVEDIKTLVETNIDKLRPTDNSNEDKKDDNVSHKKIVELS